MLLVALFLFALQAVLTIVLVSRRIDNNTDRLDTIDARLRGIAEGTQLAVNDINRRAKRRAREAADPVLAAIARAPMGEPLTQEESEAVAEGMRAIQKGGA